MAEEGTDRSVDGQPPIRSEQQPGRIVFGGTFRACRPGDESTPIGIAVHRQRGATIEADPPKAATVDIDLVDHDQAARIVARDHCLAGAVGQRQHRPIESHGQKRTGQASTRTMRDQSIGTQADEVAK